MMVGETQKRTVPQSDLDFNMLTTDAVWGKADVPQELRNKMNKYFLQKSEEGEDIVTKESLWGLLGFYTRDMRLANLSAKDGELAYVQYYIDLANDFLQSNCIEPFLIALSRAATRLELSQSKTGFLRKQMNTFTQETTHRELEPPKKNLFGKTKNPRRE
jgi:hypothetical protein